MRPFMVDRKSTRLNSSHLVISYAVFCLTKDRVRVAPLTQSDHPFDLFGFDTRLGALCLSRCVAAGSMRELVDPHDDRVAAFFFNDTATTEIYTLSLHDALPI